MLRSFVLFFLFSSCVLAQVSGEQLAFQKATAAAGDSAKIAELDKFLTQYPNSTMAPNAYAVKFQAYVNVGNDSAAFRALHFYLSRIDKSQLVPGLNAIAFEFAQRKYFLDSATVYIDSAIALYDREEPVLYNTKALILLRQQKYDAALQMQQKAIELLPENAALDGRYATFYIQMGFIQVESGRPLEGMKNVMLGNLVVPKQSLPVEKIDSILTAHGIPSSSVSLVRDSLYQSAAGDFLRRSEDSVIAKSKIAVGLSRNAVLTALAVTYAEESYAAARSRTIEERSGAAAAAGLTYYNLRRYEDAERRLSEAAAYAAPAETDIFVSLGDVKEQLGKKQEAFTAYLTAAITARSSSLYQKLIALKNELYPTGNLDSIIVAHQAAALQFTPEEYVRPDRVLNKNEFHRVVLAELFTGSECKPCQAADIAFDYLIERYRTSSLAILEYHLHIPMPDPMTNEDAERRAEYYGVRSTPTAIFNGKTMITSGGNRLMAKNKFFLYSDIIEREGKEPVPVSLTGAAALDNGTITVTGTATAPAGNKQLKVRIVLAEEEVAYKGANGIEQHKFVVRTMVTPEKGLPFPSNGKLSVKQNINLAKVTASLQGYYEKANKQYTELGAPLKENKSSIDPRRLAVVMFVQDQETKEVLQAVTVKVMDRKRKK
jgi:tetratricopeptide (TPR) repeat protein